MEHPSPKKSDLVVTDVDMPRMDGLELASRIKADPMLSHIPVVRVSYRDKDEHRLEGLQFGADRYMTKGSFRDDSFLRAISELIGSTS